MAKKVISFYKKEEKIRTCENSIRSAMLRLFGNLTNKVHLQKSTPECPDDEELKKFINDDTVNQHVNYCDRCHTRAHFLLHGSDEKKVIKALKDFFGIK